MSKTNGNKGQVSRIEILKVLDSLSFFFSLSFLSLFNRKKLWEKRKKEGSNGNRIMFQSISIWRKRTTEENETKGKSGEKRKRIEERKEENERAGEELEYIRSSYSFSFFLFLSLFHSPSHSLEVTRVGYWQPREERKRERTKEQNSVEEHEMF